MEGEDGMWREGGGGGGERRCGSGVRWRREEGTRVGMRGKGEREDGM